MFTTLKYRRHIAVLATLAMVASVMVAAPAVAADPEVDHKARYTACLGDATGSAGFEDVPAGHSSAGAIDCIAYYGITQGTSASTYSPSMSVTREHMALFLTRLAGLVGIEMTSTPDDAGFEDIGELSAESQTAINQLADLGITQGTSTTTYSPEDSVKRGHMALFIARLMNKMTKGLGGATPDDVVKSESEDKSPFTDLKGATKEAYDSITQLWELGVASGISATSYAPDASITRASMADFIAAVLGHSNARPAGLSIQAKTPSDFGMISDPGIVVSYRDDTFAAMEGIAIAIFALDPDDFDEEDGTCPNEGACKWSPNSDPTDTDGNIVYASGAVGDGDSLTVHAWMGDEDNDVFKLATANSVSVTVASMRDFNIMTASSDGNDNAGDITVAHAEAAGPLLINTDADSSLTITLQLQYDSDPADTDNAVADVARSGVEVNVDLLSQVGNATVYDNSSEAKLETDDKGRVTFTLNGPASTEGAGNNPDRDDTVTFTHLVSDNDTPGDTTDDTIITEVAYVRWSDVARTPTTAKVALGPKYQVIDKDGEISFRVTVRLYDQYGDPDGPADATHRAVLIVPGVTGDELSRVISTRGVATYSATVPASSINAGTAISVGATIDNVTATAGSVLPVTHAEDDGDAVDASSDNVIAVYADDNRFVITGGVMYTYDSDDTYLIDNESVDMAAFEKELDEDSIVDILVYNDDGASIFRIQTS
ncbi:MAG: S-layer homology domain-containing protein [bacterium]|nr:S-layer homology domain-containing protein [bacterium]